jgi:hypothetical protein
MTLLRSPLFGSPLFNTPLLGGAGESGNEESPASSSCHPDVLPKIPRHPIPNRFPEEEDLEDILMGLL